MGAGPKCGTFDKVNKEGRASGGMDQITIGSLPEGKKLGDMFFSKNISCFFRVCSSGKERMEKLDSLTERNARVRSSNKEGVERLESLTGMNARVCSPEKEWILSQFLD